MQLFKPDDLPESYRQAPRIGLKTAHAGHNLQDIAKEILILAREGLQRQKVHNNCGVDETIYLDVLEEIATSGTTLAERLLKDWTGSPANKLANLLKHCALS